MVVFTALGQIHNCLEQGAHFSVSVSVKIIVIKNWHYEVHTPGILNWFFSPFRSTHDLVAMDGWLYAVGGNDGSSSLNSIEKYNPRSNKWVAASCMFTRRSSVGVAVLELLNFPPPSSPTLSVSSTSLWHGVTTWLTSASAAIAQAGSGKRRNCSVWEVVEGRYERGLVNMYIQHCPGSMAQLDWPTKAVKCKA